jgi:hypothetical protein
MPIKGVTRHDNTGIACEIRIDLFIVANPHCGTSFHVLIEILDSDPRGSYTKLELVQFEQE